MFMPSDLPRVSMRELSREPGEVLVRVLKGERLIVCRHGHPVATLQPLDGCVTQPFTGTEHDVLGSPLGDIDREIAKLRPIEKRMLMDGVKWDRIRPGLPIKVDFSEAMAMLNDWELRGLARRGKRGWLVTGRAVMLREALLAKAGRRAELYD
jgi:prevent-host-death family protein